MGCPISAFCARCANKRLFYPLASFPTSPNENVGRYGAPTFIPLEFSRRLLGPLERVEFVEALLFLFLAARFVVRITFGRLRLLLFAVGRGGAGIGAGLHLRGMGHIVGLCRSLCRFFYRGQGLVIGWPNRRQSASILRAWNSRCGRRGCCAFRGYGRADGRRGGWTRGRWSLTCITLTRTDDALPRSQVPRSPASHYPRRAHFPIAASHLQQVRAPTHLRSQLQLAPRPLPALRGSGLLERAAVKSA